MVVHSRIQETFAVPFQGIGRHRDDRHPALRCCFEFSDGGGGLQAVQAWHLNIHENKIVMVLLKCADGGRAARHEIEMERLSFEHETYHPLVDRVILHDQEPGAAVGRRLGLLGRGIRCLLA